MFFRVHLSACWTRGAIHEWASHVFHCPVWCFRRKVYLNTSLYPLLPLSRRFSRCFVFLPHDVLFLEIISVQGRIWNTCLRLGVFSNYRSVRFQSRLLLLGVKPDVGETPLSPCGEGRSVLSNPHRVVRTW